MLQEIEKKIKELQAACEEMKKEINNRQLEAKTLKEDVENTKRENLLEAKEVEKSQDEMEKLKVRDRDGHQYNNSTLCTLCM